MYEAYEKLRDAKGVTDYEVSKQTGVATATLSSWKYGSYTPKYEKIAKLAAYFDVPVETFYAKPDGEV